MSMFVGCARRCLSFFFSSGTWPFRPFRSFRSQVEDLIDWKKAPDDPMFQLVFPQPGMLSPKDLQRSVSAKYLTPLWKKPGVLLASLLLSLQGSPSPPPPDVLPSCGVVVASRWT